MLTYAPRCKRVARPRVRTWGAAAIWLVLAPLPLLLLSSSPPSPPSLLLLRSHPFLGAVTLLLSIPHNLRMHRRAHTRTMHIHTDVFRARDMGVGGV